MAALPPQQEDVLPNNRQVEKPLRQVKRLEDEKNDLTAKVRSLEEEKENLIAKVGSLEDEKEDLIEDFKSLEDDNEQLNSELDAMEPLCNRYRDRCNDLVHACEAFRVDRDRDRAEVQSLRATNDRLQSRVTRSVTDNEQLRAENVRLRSRQVELVGQQLRHAEEWDARFRAANAHPYHGMPYDAAGAYYSRFY